MNPDSKKIINDNIKAVQSDAFKDLLIFARRNNKYGQYYESCIKPSPTLQKTIKRHNQSHTKD